jgi:hypothetical protein
LHEVLSGLIFTGEGRIQHWTSLCESAITDEGVVFVVLDDVSLRAEVTFKAMFM